MWKLFLSAMAIGLLGTSGCTRIVDQNTVKNTEVREHRFLSAMYTDDLYPVDLVNDVRDILVRMCLAIEHEGVQEVRHLYPITHHFTKEINKLQDDFERADSEIETVAREAIAEEFVFIAKAYGFDADVEEMIAPREW